MIWLKEFWRARRMLGRSTRPRPFPNKPSHKVDIGKIKTWDDLKKLFSKEPL